MLRLLLMLSLVLIAKLAPGQLASYSDGDLSNWSSTVLSASGASTGSSSTDPGLGLPAGSLRVEHVVNVGPAAITMLHLPQDPAATFDPASLGALGTVALSVNVLPLSFPVSFNWAACQGGAVYLLSPQVVSSGWVTVSDSDVSSSQWLGGFGPDFGCGAPITFGIVTANSNNTGLPAYTNVIHFDNFSVSVSGQGVDLCFGPLAGPGSLVIDNVHGIPNALYVTALTTSAQNAVAPRQGWWFGLHIPIQELLDEATGGPPFTGFLDPTGDSSFVVPSGTIPPLGITLYAVTAVFDPATGLLAESSNVVAAGI